MRAAFVTVLCLTLRVVSSTTAQASPPRKSSPPPLVTKAPVSQATVPPAAPTQSSPPWKAILRVIPNPLPPGRCATASVEIQDGDGYRATTLSNGATIDFHQFVFLASDTSTLKWREGAPVFGVICAPANATSAKTSITVTLPDGLVGSSDLTVLGPGLSTAPVQYPAQGRLRPATLPAAQMMSASTAPLATPLTSAPPSSTAGSVGAGPPIGLGADDNDGWSGMLTVDAGSVPVRLIRGGSAALTMLGIGAAKRAAGVSYEPIVVSTALTPFLIAWINSAWQGTPTPMNGTLIAQTAPVTSVAGHLTFAGAFVTSTWIPDLSSAGKSNGVIITMAPQYVRAASATSTAAAPPPTPPISGFQLKVSGLSSGAVKGIKSFEVQTPVGSSVVGDRQSPQTAPVFSNVFVTLDERSAADWISWYQDFVIGGNGGTSNERTFTLDLIGPSSSIPIASVKGYGVGIVSLRANTAANAHGMLIAELYTKRMELVTSGSK